jgi:Zn-dependent protease with chaperone function
MSRLQSLPPLHAVVRSVSDKVGRPWIESTFNAIRLGPRQLPDVWNQAVLAARILGLPNMPDVYISGDQMWNTYTYGTENSSFIVLGTSHLINFANDELLFVLAREMGHCRAGHALWKTVTRFIAGDTSIHSGLLSDGLINAIHPSKLIQGALDLPLMAWARQSEISADRAGLLAVGDEALARRVLLAWSVRSARLLQQVNIEEWMKQEEASDDQVTRLSEMTTSSSMYTTRRLRLLGQAAHEEALMRWSRSIQPVRKKLAPAPVEKMAGLGVGTMRAASAQRPAASAASGAGRPGQSAPGEAARSAVPLAGAAQTASAAPVVAAQAAPVAPAGVTAPAPKDSIRVVCNQCQAAMQVPFAVLRGKTVVNVRCPQCQNVLTLRARGPAAPAKSPAAPPAPASAPQKSAAPPPIPENAASKPVAPPPLPGGAAKKPAAVPANVGAKK